MPVASLRGRPRPPRFSLSFFPDVFDQRPIPRQVAWETLVARLSCFSLRADVIDKLRLPCWAPAAFCEDAPAVAGAVDAVSLLVLDIDGGDIDEALDRCMPFTVLAHTSWSHQTEVPRFRLVLPLARPVPGDRWSEAWALAVGALQLPVDRLCCNANRRYLLPALPKSDAPHRVEVCDTELALDLLPLLPAAEARVRVPAPLRVVRVPHHSVQRATRRRLCEPEVRRGLAERLGALVRGAGANERAEGLSCPACGRTSVWFLLAPERATRARCKHRHSCGWSGPLADLLASAA